MLISISFAGKCKCIDKRHLVLQRFTVLSKRQPRVKSPTVKMNGGKTIMTHTMVLYRLTVHMRRGLQTTGFRLAPTMQAKNTCAHTFDQAGFLLVF